MSTLASTMEHSPFECPICLQHYADVDPTTFPCGHSCCVDDAKTIKNRKCHICREDLPSPGKIVPNYTLRDVSILQRKNELKLAEEKKAAAEASRIQQEEAEAALKAATDAAAKAAADAKAEKDSATVFANLQKLSLDVPVVVTDDSHLIKPRSLQNPTGEESDEDEKKQIASIKVNPMSLPIYDFKVYPQRSKHNVDGPRSNLEFHFYQSLPLKELFRNAGMSNDDNPTYQGILVKTAEYIQSKEAIVKRVLVQNEEDTIALLIDVLSVRLAPHEILHRSVLNEVIHGLDEYDRSRYPLMVVRFNCTTKEMIDKGHTEFFAEIQGNLQRREKIMNFETNTKEITLLHELLKSNATKLSTGFVKRFRREQKALFTPSFIVPTPRESPELQKVEGSCSLQGCQKAGWAICGKCKSAQYCSREHQVEHWKVHKKVCGKTHVELSSGNSTENTVVVPIDVRIGGQFNDDDMTVLTNLRSGTTTLREQNASQRNIHGDRKFLVKIQRACDIVATGLRASTDKAMVVYDETRSFTLHIQNSLQPQYNAVNQAVAAKGLDCYERTGTHDCLKGYCYAKREGNNLRLYLDKFVPEPNW